jgi:hypothetical protein
VFDRWKGTGKQQAIAGLLGQVGEAQAATVNVNPGASVASAATRRRTGCVAAWSTHGASGACS